MLLVKWTLTLQQRKCTHGVKIKVHYFEILNVICRTIKAFRPYDDFIFLQNYVQNMLMNVLINKTCSELIHVHSRFTGAAYVVTFRV
jgi:hypothetical protein